MTHCARRAILVGSRAMNEPAIQVWPSLLAGDFGRLADSARAAERAGADALHLDIMDGHFVPNLSMGPDVVRMARRAVRIPLNVHLMLTRPDTLARAFVEAGATTLTLHVESACDVACALRAIRALGARAGIVANPETPFEALAPFLAESDEVLCMSVHPGFGGQRFIPAVLPKLAALRRWARAAGRESGPRALDLSVDGGIDLETGPRAAAAGANCLIAGSALYKAKAMADDVRALRERAASAFCRDAG